MAHSFTSRRHVGPWKLGGHEQMKWESNAEQRPPLAQGFEAQGSACWHVLPVHPGGQRQVKVLRVSREQVPPLRHGELMQAWLTGVRHSGPLNPSMHSHVKSTSLPCVRGRHEPPLRQGDGLQGLGNWH